VPYWNGATYARILRCLGLGSVINGGDLDELKSRISKMLGARDAILCSSGTYALELALRYCEIGRGDEVVIPAFCCSAVVAPVLAVGAQPVLADVGADLNLTPRTIAAVLTRRTRAVIVPHLFGNPADIRAIAALARNHNIRLIDDAAQALGATVDGQALGSFGDAGILSFGSEKVCFGIGGGALISRSGDLSGLIPQSMMGRPSTAETLSRFASTLFWRRWRWTSPLRALVSQERLRDPAAPSRPYQNQRMPNLGAAIACDLLDSLDENLSERRTRVGAYRELFAEVHEVDLIPHAPDSACLTQLVHCRPNSSGEDMADRLIAALRARGYEARGSYLPIHLLEDSRNTVWDGLPYTDRVWPDLVELTCEPEVSLASVEEIAAIVRATVSRKRSKTAASRTFLSSDSCGRPSRNAKKRK
jgi:dTDP-4-amino-4,6-dideoxygalactose transaminase